MKKTISSLAIATLCLFNNPSQASIQEDIAPLFRTPTPTKFNAINRVEITDNDPSSPFGGSRPSPGDFFNVTGYALLDAGIEGIELTASYSIGGTFTGFNPASGKLFFNHGNQASGASNLLTVYADNATTANQDLASSYTDGTVVATFDVITDAAGGFFYADPSQTGSGTFPVGGEDSVSFRLRDEYKDDFNISNDQDLLFDISTTIYLADIIDDHMVFPLIFGAFDNDCGSPDNQLTSCSRELGTGGFSVIDEAVVPLPPALGLFLSGIGLLGWFGKRKTA